jgi:hypothetical protein
MSQSIHLSSFLAESTQGLTIHTYLYSWWKQRVGMANPTFKIIKPQSTFGQNAEGPNLYYELRTRFYHYRDFGGEKLFSPKYRRCAV